MKIPSEREFLDLIVETLNLSSDIEITPDTLLFGSDLGLNSVDALEIGAVINERYKIELRPKDEAAQRAFASVRAMHAYVANQMQRMLRASEANAA